MADEQNELAAEDRPDWIPERYKNSQEFVKAWEEQNKTITQLSQERSAAQQATAQIAQRLSELEAAQEQQSWQQPAWGAQPGYGGQDDWVNRYQAAYDEGDARTVLAMNAELARYAAEQAISQRADQFGPQQAAVTQLFAAQTQAIVGQRYGDEWEDLKGEVASTLQRFPHLIPNTTDPQVAADAISFVADKIRSDRLAEQTARLDTQQQQAAREKRLAQTMIGGNGRTADQPSDREALFESLKAVPRIGLGS